MLSFISNNLSVEDRNFLNKHIEEEELFTVVKNSSNKKKYNGSDGIPYEIYLKKLNEIKFEFVDMLNLLFSGKQMPSREFTNSVTILIPKKNNPEIFDDYRPINLLNTDYKIYAKVLAKR